MNPRPSEVMFSDSVRAEQARRGSREAYERMDSSRGWTAVIPDDVATFIAERDSLLQARRLNLHKRSKLVGSEM